MECVVAKKDIFVKNAPKYKDVHSIDIITIRTPDDGVKVRVGVRGGSRLRLELGLRLGLGC